MRTSTIKSIAALALTGVGSALVLGFKTTDVATVGTTGQSGSGSAGGSASAAGSGSGSSGTSSSGSSSSGSTKSGGSAGSATYHDGTWTGTAVSEPWGPFQVQVVVSGGTITKISVVESPSDRHSSRINGVAVPLLTQATLAAQNATVDMVSGATWTSDSYATSLQSALDKAARAA